MSASFSPADLSASQLNAALMSPTSPAVGNGLMGGPAAMRSPQTGAESGLVQPETGLHTSSDTHVHDTGESVDPANDVNGNVVL